MRFLIIPLLLLISGCSFLRFPDAPANQPKKQYNSRELIRTEPIIRKIIDSAGKELTLDIGQKIEHEFIMSAEETGPKPSIWSKLRSLGILGIILGVASILFPPLAMILGVVFRGLDFSTRKIVRGIDRALDNMKDKEERERFLRILSEEYDDKTKEIVAKYKHS